MYRIQCYAYIESVCIGISVGVGVDIGIVNCVSMSALAKSMGEDVKVQHSIAIARHSMT